MLQDIIKGLQLHLLLMVVLLLIQLETGLICVIRQVQLDFCVRRTVVDLPTCRWCIILLWHSHKRLIFILLSILLSKELHTESFTSNMSINFLELLVEDLNCIIIHFVYIPALLMTERQLIERPGLYCVIKGTLLGNAIRFCDELRSLCQQLIPKLLL